MLQHESAEGGAVTQPARAISFGRHGAAAQAVADVPAHQALACSLAEALQHRCFDYSVDTAWMSNTHDAWKTMLSSAIHKNGLNRRLAAATDIQAGGTMQRGAVVEGRPDAQVHYAYTVRPSTVHARFELLSDSMHTLKGSSVWHDKQ